MRPDRPVLESKVEDPLVQRLQDRDKEALGDFVSRYGSMMYAVALQMMRDDRAAQEVVQDALIMVWNKINQFEGRSKFTTWLYRVTANAALMELRRAKNLREHVSIEDVENERNQERQASPLERPDNTALRHEIATEVKRAIDTLPEPYRATVLLADVDGLSLAEIGDLMRVTEPAVKSRLHRARLMLRKKLRHYLGPGGSRLS